MDDVILRADGVEYRGWTKVQVTRSLEAMAGSFTLELTFNWQGKPDQYRAFMAPIKQGKPCTIDIGNDRVITGYVDDWVPSYDDKQVIISVTGRDKTSDLIDCSIVYPSGQFVNQTLTQIANTVCKPFGIDVVVNVDDITEPFKRIQIEQGETPHELLTRLARQRGVLLTNDALGRLVITRSTKESAGVSLILGQNILAARGRFSWRNRFSQFIVKASGAGFGDWGDDNNAVGGLKAEITDDEVMRYRPIIIVNEEITTAEGASRRGQWERQRSIGRSNSAEYTVTGWRIPETGKVWGINTLVPVRDEILDLNEDMLINTLMFSEDDGGRIAVIGVVHPDALDIPSQIESSTKIGGDTW